MAASYARVFYPFTISEKDYRSFSAAQNTIALRRGTKDTNFDFSTVYDGIFFCFFSFLTHVLTQNGKKYMETAEPSSPKNGRFCGRQHRAGADIKRSLRHSLPAHPCAADMVLDHLVGEGDELFGRAADLTDEPAFDDTCGGDDIDVRHQRGGLLGHARRI